MSESGHDQESRRFNSVWYKDSVLREHAYLGFKDEDKGTVRQICLDLVKALADRPFWMDYFGEISEDYPEYHQWSGRSEARVSKWCGEGRPPTYFAWFEGKKRSLERRKGVGLKEVIPDWQKDVPEISQRNVWKAREAAEVAQRRRS